MLEEIIEMPSFCVVFMWNNNFRRDGIKSSTESETIQTLWGDSAAAPLIAMTIKAQTCSPWSYSLLATYTTNKIYSFITKTIL